MTLRDTDGPQAAAQAEQTAPDQEFQLLDEMAQTILEAARALVAVLGGSTPPDEAWQAIRDLEHKGDAIARDLFEGLVTPRPMAVDTDALKALTGYLDALLHLLMRHQGKVVRRERLLNEVWGGRLLRGHPDARHAHRMAAQKG